MECIFVGENIFFPANFLSLFLFGNYLMKEYKKKFLFDFFA